MGKEPSEEAIFRAMRVLQIERDRMRGRETTKVIIKRDGKTVHTWDRDSRQNAG